MNHSAELSRELSEWKTHILGPPMSCLQNRGQRSRFLSKALLMDGREDGLTASPDLCPLFCCSVPNAEPLPPPAPTMAQGLTAEDPPSMPC